MTTTVSTETDAQQQSDQLFREKLQGYVRVVTTQAQGFVPAGSVFWVLPEHTREVMYDGA